MSEQEKRALVDRARRRLAGQMRQELRALYRDIVEQAAGERDSVLPSYLSMREGTQVSAYTGGLFEKMRETFCQALREVPGGEGRLYSDSQITLMWQAAAAGLEPPRAAVADAGRLRAALEQAGPRRRASVPLGTVLLGIVCAAGLAAPVLVPVHGAAALGLRGAALAAGGGALFLWRRPRPAERRAPADRAAGAARLMEKQCEANAAILEAWIDETARRVEESEPLL